VKIDATVRDAFEEQEAVANALRAEVDRDLRQRKDATWHYVSRVKGLESFALKVETGRISSLAEVEDVFAATIVVPQWSEIAAARDLVLEKYELHERRPPTDDETSKSPDSFRFDDLRMYVRYRRVEGEKTAIPDGALFEVQIKTFLQHAWAVATHDVIYKSPKRDWRRERVAHQVRASLESAEVAIGNIDSLAASTILPGIDSEIAELNAIIVVLEDHWSQELLPTNIRRLAENVCDLMRVVDRRWDADRPAILSTLLDAGKARNLGAHSIDWSPYRSVLNYVAHDHSSKLRARVIDPKSKKKLLVYPEVLEALSVEQDQAIAAVVVGS
jgi:ppGpp synthetase/RelA/SpoT-type nucleotidyltranferase